jgi:hypothetical protein
VARCVKEVVPVDIGRPNVVIKPELVPDDRTRCHWIMTQIDVGRNEMLIRFRYYCPDECVLLMKTDTISHDTYCRDPKPDCEALKTRLASMDKTSLDFERLSRLIRDVCLIPPIPKPDPIVPPVTTECEAIRLKLSQMDPASPDYAKLKLYYTEHCLNILPPPPPPEIKPPVAVDCEALRLKLSLVDPASKDYVYIKDMIAKNCPDSTIVK